MIKMRFFRPWPFAVRPTWSRWQTLVALFCFAFALRGYNLFAPLLDTHSWRQADTAAIARNFVASGYDFLHPQVNWGGATAGYVESEFPLYTGVLALLFGAFGPQPWLGRLLSALFSAATPVVLYCLVKQQHPTSRHNRRVALYAAFALSVLPFAVYFGRTVMPDSLMLLTATLAIWTFQRWLGQPTVARFLFAVTCGALAPLAKTPNLLIVALPLAYLALRWRRGRRGRGSGVGETRRQGDKEKVPIADFLRSSFVFRLHHPTVHRPPSTVHFAFYAVAFTLPVLVWTRYAATLPSDPRLSFGIGEKLFDLRLLSDRQFYLLLGRWIAEDVLTWAGVVCVALFCVLTFRQEDKKTKRQENKNTRIEDINPNVSVSPFLRVSVSPLLPWLLGVLAFFLAGAAGVVGQDYYVLPLVTPAAWLIGTGIAGLQYQLEQRTTDNGQQATDKSILRRSSLVPIIAFGSIALFSIWRIAPMYQTTDFYRQLGQRADAALPAGERVGVIAPAVSEILYYGNRKGWRLDPGVLVPGGLSSLGPDLGVHYLIVTDPALSNSRELLTNELRAYRRLPVGPYALLLDLQQPGYGGDFEIIWQTGSVVTAPFLAAWRDGGGVATLGLPIADAANTQQGHIQYFERAVLQADGARVRFAPAGRWLLQARGQTPQPSAVAEPFVLAWQQFGGETTLGLAISPLENGVQIFQNGALEQRADGSIGLGAIGRWLEEAQSSR